MEFPALSVGLASVMPMLMASDVEWFPTSSALWQVPQLPVMGWSKAGSSGLASGSDAALLMPATFAMVNVRLLKSASPRPMARCSRVSRVQPELPWGSHAWYRLKIWLVKPGANGSF